MDGRIENEFDTLMERTATNFQTAEFSLNVGPIVRTVPPYELQYREKGTKHVAHYKLGDVIGEGMSSFAHSVFSFDQAAISVFNVTTFFCRQLWESSRSD